MLMADYTQLDYNVENTPDLEMLTSLVMLSEDGGELSMEETILNHIGGAKKEEEYKVCCEKIQKSLFQNFIVSKSILARERRINSNKRLARIRAVKGLAYSIYKEDSKRGKSDNDIIYVWKNQHNEYKIGITSKKSGTKRIETVAQAGKMEATMIYYVEVNDALSVEKALLSYGEPITRKVKFDGHTEFRILSKAKLKEIGEILASAGI